MADTVAYVHARRAAGHRRPGRPRRLDAGRLDELPRGVGRPRATEPRKIAAIGVRLTRGRSMHGFALNVDPDLAMFGHIVPVRHRRQGRHLAARPRASTSRMAEVVDAVAAPGRRRAGARGGVGPRRRGLARPPPPTWRRSAGGEGPGEVAAPAADGPSRRRGAAPRCACSGRLAEAGVDRWPRHRRRASPSGCGPRSTIGPELPPRSSARCATSTWSRCARRPAAPTSSSAGPTAPPRS